MATDTLAFIVKHAELFILTCWKCGHVVKMTPDDIRAKANRGLEEERFSFQNRSRCSKCGMRCPKHETIWKAKKIRIGSYGRGRYSSTREDLVRAMKGDKIVCPTCRKVVVTFKKDCENRMRIPMADMSSTEPVAIVEPFIHDSDRHGCEEHGFDVMRPVDGYWMISGTISR